MGGIKKDKSQKVSKQAILYFWPWNIVERWEKESAGGGDKEDRNIIEGRTGGLYRDDSKSIKREQRLLSPPPSPSSYWWSPEYYNLQISSYGGILVYFPTTAFYISIYGIYLYMIFSHWEALSAHRHTGKVDKRESDKQKTERHRHIDKHKEQNTYLYQTKSYL